jgi:CPA2 family monovalent cation:H+ antiporter-2
MNHLPTLITDLALLLACAGGVTLLFRKLKQPVVLGYIVAGLLIGPSLEAFPTVGDVASIRTWAEIGVIVLLYAMGLEFSFKRLLQLGKTVAGTAVVEIGGMFALGYAAAAFLGWQGPDRIFLGGAVAISSTTIIFRAFDELGLRSKKFTDIVLGVLVVEDLVAILLLVLLPNLVTGQPLQGDDVLWTLGRLLGFLVAWFLLGTFVLPSVLKRLASGLQGETLLVFSLALGLGMAVWSVYLGYSPALGAFAMGSLLADTVWGHRIAQAIKPIQTLFGAVFFVSVGILIDPSALLDYWPVVLGLAVLVAVGKSVLVSSGALAAGVPLKQAVQAGSSMVQIGEFSFIVAGLGLTLGVMRPELYPILVGVSILTTFLTPYSMRAAQPVVDYLHRRLPPSVVRNLEAYSSNTQRLDGEARWHSALRFYLQTVGLNAAVSLLILVGVDRWMAPLLSSFMPGNWGRGIAAAAGLALAGPFLWALVAKKPRSGAAAQLWLDRGYSKGPLVMVEIVRHAVALALVVVHLRLLFNSWIALGGGALLAAAAAVLLKQRLQHLHQRLERHFWSNYHEKDRQESDERRDYLSPWDAHLSRMTVPPNADFVGRTLESLAWREQFGINVAYIERGSRVIYAPSRVEMLYPHDQIGLLGTDAQLDSLLATWQLDAEGSGPDWEMELLQVPIDDQCLLAGQSIRDSELRERTKGLVVGLERKGERVLNPPSGTVLQRGDVLWMVANKAALGVFYSR